MIANLGMTERKMAGYGRVNMSSYSHASLHLSYMSYLLFGKNYEFYNY